MLGHLILKGPQANSSNIPWVRSMNCYWAVQSYWGKIGNTWASWSVTAFPCGFENSSWQQQVRFPEVAFCLLAFLELQIQELDVNCLCLSRRYHPGSFTQGTALAGVPELVCHTLPPPCHVANSPLESFFFVKQSWKSWFPLDGRLPYCALVGSLSAV